MASNGPVKNNGGTMVANGSSTGLESLASVQPAVGVFGSTPYNGSDAGVTVSGGEFAHNHNAPIAPRITNELAGVATDAMATVANNTAGIRDIHKLETLRTRRQTSAIRLGKWDQYSGEFDAGFPVVAVDTLPTDVAATPSRSVPGKLNFLAGGVLPKSVDYKARTN